MPFLDPDEGARVYAILDVALYWLSTRRRRQNKRSARNIPRRIRNEHVSCGTVACPCWRPQVSRVRPVTARREISMSQISQRAQAGIAAFALPLLMSSAALTFEMNGNPDGVRGEGPCSEASEPCLPRQTRPGVPGVSPALSDVLGRGNSHRNRNKAGELRWIYSEGHQTNYPNTGSRSAVQSPQPQGLRLYTRTARRRSRPQMALTRLCQSMFMGSLGKVSGSSLATELHISYPRRRAVTLAISLPIRTKSRKATTRTEVASGGVGGRPACDHAI